MTIDQKELMALVALRNEVRERLLEVPDYVKWLALNTAIRQLEPKTSNASSVKATQTGE